MRGLFLLGPCFSLLSWETVSGKYTALQPAQTAGT
jgi:hypothetical protein